MTKKAPNTRLPKTVLPAIVLILLVTGAPQVLAQGPGPGATGGSAPPAAPSNQASPAPGGQNATATPPSGSTVGTTGTGGSRIPGHTGQVSTVEVKPDPIVEQSEKEVSRRIKSICRGC
jgi:hypothetical protein